MAAEGDASQPPPVGNEKPQASKIAPSFVSTFINKNTGGKKFAPKAARRRPGAAGPSTSQKPSTPQSTPAPEAQTTQVPPSHAPTTEPQAAPQDALPTPATTQDTNPQEAQRTEQTDRDSRAPETSVETSAPVATPDPTPSKPIVEDTASQAEDGTHTIRPKLSRRAEEEPDSSHPRKRQRVEIAQDVEEGASISEPPAAVLTQDTSTIAETTRPDTQIAIESTPEPPQADAALLTVEQPPATSITTAPADATAGASGEGEERDIAILDVQAPVQPRRGSRRVSWVAVNQARDDEHEVVETAPNTQPPGRTSGRSRITSTNETGEVGAAGDDAEAQVTTGRTTRGRSRRSAADDTTMEWEPEALPKPPPKPRKPRKDKGTKKRKQGVLGQEDQAGEEAVTVTDGQPPKKKRATRRKRAAAQTETGEEGAEGAAEDQTQPSRSKGRRREATPSDAEDQVIDTANTFMDGLASRRGPRTGQISQREQKMRNIDWDAVKQRRREENAIGVGSVGSRRAVDEALAQAGEARAEALAAQSRGPAFREVNGQIVLIQEAAVIDREADADREIELMEEVEEDDLTNRITSASFLREDKRFPKEFLLPGQGKKWTTEGTEAFYDALQMFGTDFMMISTLFPGTTRRSIKTKFNREERENPRRIKDALNGQRNSNWAEYLTRSGMEDDAFVDPTAIENELQEERERMRVSIEAAKQAKAEEDRQKDLAGVLREENEGEKENEDGRRRRKRKEKPKTVSFEAEEGVEILPLDDE